MGSDSGLGMPPLPNALLSLRSRCERGELRSSPPSAFPLPPPPLPLLVAVVVELHATGVPPPRPLSRDEGLKSVAPSRLPAAEELTNPPPLPPPPPPALLVVEFARHAGEFIVMFNPE